MSVDKKCNHSSQNSSLPTRDSMNKEEFDAMMQKGHEEAQAGLAFPLNELDKETKEIIRKKLQNPEARRKVEEINKRIIEELNKQGFKTEKE